MSVSDECRDKMWALVRSLEDGTFTYDKFVAGAKRALEHPYGAPREHVFVHPEELRVIVDTHREMLDESAKTQAAYVDAFDALMRGGLRRLPKGVVP